MTAFEELVALFMERRAQTSSRDTVGAALASANAELLYKKIMSEVGAKPMSNSIQAIPALPIKTDNPLLRGTLWLPAEFNKFETNAQGDFIWFWVSGVHIAHTVSDASVALGIDVRALGWEGRL